jgi:hypothetical protein
VSLIPISPSDTKLNTSQSDILWDGVLCGLNPAMPLPNIFAIRYTRSEMTKKRRHKGTSLKLWVVMSGALMALGLIFYLQWRLGQVLT